MEQLPRISTWIAGGRFYALAVGPDGEIQGQGTGQSEEAAREAVRASIRPVVAVPLLLKAGDRVRMTEYAIQQGLQGKLNRRTGVVVRRNARQPQLLVIQRDGCLYKESYHQNFWEPEHGEE